MSPSLQTDFKTADTDTNTDQDIEKNLVGVAAPLGGRFPFGGRGSCRRCLLRPFCSREPSCGSGAV